MNHTPAPWFIVDNVPEAAIGYRAIVDDEGTTICDPSPMGEANARLIAAAPELLAALQLADKWVAMYHTLPGHEAASESMSRVIRAAINRAKGKQ